MDSEKKQHRLVRALNDDPERSPQELLAHMRSAVDGFVREARQYDDLTMLCVEYKGRGYQ